jgi:hypothetical protein
MAAYLGSGSKTYPAHVVLAAQKLKGDLIAVAVRARGQLVTAETEIWLHIAGLGVVAIRYLSDYPNDGEQ